MIFEEFLEYLGKAAAVIIAAAALIALGLWLAA